MIRIMFQRLTLGVLIVLGFVSAVLLPGPAAVSEAASWCVAPSLPGPCASFSAARRKTTLSDVIAAPASPGDSVDIYPGTYTDRPTVTIRGLQIKGVQGPAVTIFDGEGSSEAALTVRAGDVVLDGFTFTHSQPAGAGGVGGGVDAGPSGDPGDPAQGRCENLDRETPIQICGNSTVPVVGNNNYVPPYLGGTAVNQCLPIVYPRNYTDKSGVNPTCPHALPGAFTLKNSHASNNWSNVTCDGTTPRCYGVKVIARGLITITNVEASNNGSDVDCTGHGYERSHGHGQDGESCFGIMAHSAGQAGGVVMNGIRANNNRAKGNCANHETCFGVNVDETLRDVTLNKIVTTNNGADNDCSGDDSCFGTGADGVEGKLTMSDVVSRDNGAKGSCGPSVNDSCLGIMIDGEDWSGSLTMTRIVADHNGAFGGDCSGNDSCTGIIIDGHGGDIILAYVEANDNGATGDCNNRDSCGGILNDAADIVGKFSLDHVQANRNGAGGKCGGSDSCFGIYHDTSFCSGDVEFSMVEASDNGSVDDCTARDSCQGIVIDSGDVTGSFKLTDVKANRNGSKNGNCTSDDSCQGLLIDGGGVDLDPLNPEDIAPFCSVITPKIKKFTAVLTRIEASFNGAGRNCTTKDQCNGINVDGVLGSLTMNDVDADDNKAGNTCSGSNSCSGVIAEVSPAVNGSVLLCNVRADRNGVGVGGSCNTPSSCYGVRAETEPDEPNTNTANVSLGRVSTNFNFGDGTVVASSRKIFIANSTSTGNGGTNLVTNTAPSGGGVQCRPAR